jgi:hypothetical protein
MKRLFLLVLGVVAFGVAGCGGTCEDACNNAYSCLQSQGVDPVTFGLPATAAGCQSYCDAIDCDGKGNFLSCIEDAQCPDIATFGAAAEACVVEEPACGAIFAVGT